MENNETTKEEKTERKSESLSNVISTFYYILLIL